MLSAEHSVYVYFHMKSIYSAMWGSRRGGATDTFRRDLNKTNLSDSPLKCRGGPNPPLTCRSTSPSTVNTWFRGFNVGNTQTRIAARKERRHLSGENIESHVEHSTWTIGWVRPHRRVARWSSQPFGSIPLLFSVAVRAVPSVKDVVLLKVRVALDVRRQVIGDFVGKGSSSVDAPHDKQLYHLAPLSSTVPPVLLDALPVA